VTIRIRIKPLVFLLVLALFAGVFYFALNSGKQKGLHEYVRRGFAFMDKNKHDKGLKLLLLAHKSLPQSEKIKNELLRGYLRYASHLQSEGKIEAALKLLDDAYAVNDKNQSLIMSLSYLYSKLGVSKIKNGLLVEGKEYLEKGISVAMQSKRARKDISTYLFSEAVTAYEHKDHSTAVICLNSSYLLWSRFKTLYLLGLLYYAEANPQTALFYWKKAAMIDRDNKELNEYLRRASEEVLLEEKKAIIETEHFNITLYRPYDLDAERLTEMLEKIFLEVGRDLDHYPSSKTPIVIYDEGDFRNVFKQPYVIRGFYDGSIRIPITIDVNSPAFSVILAHEYTHAVVSILTNRKCPAWLNEAIATYEQAKYAPVYLSRLKAFLDNGGTLSIKVLTDGFISIGDNAKTILSYEGAFTVAAFIIDKWGWVSMRRLLKRIKEGRHYSNAIDEEFLVSVETFEKMWNNFAKGRCNE